MHSATAMPNGAIYVCGGKNSNNSDLTNHLEKYNTQKNQWTTIRIIDFKIKLGLSPITSSDSDKFYLLGGELYRDALSNDDTDNERAVKCTPCSTEDILEFCTRTDSAKLSDVYLDQPRSFH